MKKIAKHTLDKMMTGVLLLILFILYTLLNPSKADDEPYSEFSHYASVQPFYSAENQVHANFMLLMDSYNNGKFLNINTVTPEDILDYQYSAALEKQAQNAQLGEDGKLKKEQPNKQKQVSGIPATFFYMPNQYIESKNKEQAKIETELKQFGAMNSPRALDALTNLKKFNQTVVQDSMIDNVQKQLLIGLRGSLFSYHFRETTNDDQTLTSDEIITKRISELPDSGRMGEYKQYLLGLDAYKNNNLDQAKSVYEILVNAKQPWIAESASYMLIQIEIAQVYELFEKLNAEGKLSNVDVKKAMKKDFNPELLIKENEIAVLIKNYQKLYPQNDNLLKLKLDFFELLAKTSAQVDKVDLLNMQASFFEEFIKNEQTYHNVMRTMPYIVDEIIYAYPFSIKRSLKTTSKSGLEKFYDEQHKYPLLDFLEILFQLSDKSKITKGSHQKFLIKRANEVAAELQGIGLKTLADYLKIEVEWRVHHNPKNILNKISDLNLDINQAYKHEIFAIYMIQSEALIKLKRNEEAFALWTSLLELDINPVTHTYLTLRLKENGIQ